MQGVKQQGLVIYDNQIAHFANQLLETESSPKAKDTLNRLHKPSGQKTYGHFGLKSKIEAFEQMENTSIRSSLGYAAGSDDESIFPRRNQVL